MVGSATDQLTRKKRWRRLFLNNEIMQSPGWGVTGDFNHPEIGWENNTAGHSSSSMFWECLGDTFLLQYPLPYHGFSAPPRPMCLLPHSPSPHHGPSFCLGDRSLRVSPVPQGSTTKNGLQCPTCFDLNSNTCNGTITPCTGDETYCIDFTGKIVNGTTSPFAAKGCATASVQDIKPGTFLASGPSTYLFSRATSVPAEKTPLNGASPALGKVSFALYLPGLLLVKLLS
uniref:UPAR/Ly6 domain-containing protein n=1 Tax=Chelydra serpentina TaxID=8475 RepID=A0A8C3TCU6_CHESE